jgi:heptosyltransferase-2
MRSLAPDTVLLFPNSFEAALSARLWGAHRRIGFAGDWRTFLLTHPVSPPAGALHQVYRYRLLLDPLGLTAEEKAPVWRLPSGGDLAERSRGLLEEVGLPHGRLMVGLHVGAAFGPSKLWLTERFASLCRLLESEKIATVLFGSPADQAIGRQIQAEAGVPVASLIGRDTLELLPHLLSHLDVFVSGDTGTAHLAAALGIPVLALFGPTDPGLTRPLGPVSATIWKSPPCAPCFLPHCPIDHVCMRSISVEEVLEKVQDRLSRRVALSTPPPAAYPPLTPNNKTRRHAAPGGQRYLASRRSVGFSTTAGGLWWLAGLTAGSSSKRSQQRFQFSR